MPDAPPPLHALETEVMDEVWERGEATVRDVQEALNRRTGKERAYTTLLTVMGRLDGKGMLVRRRDGRLDVYAPVMSRDDYLQERAAADTELLVATFGDRALALFTRYLDELDPERRERVRRLAREPVNGHAG